MIYISGLYTCSLTDHVLGLDFGVASEEECAQLCWNTDGCNFYSYYSIDGSPLQLACAKLSECNDRTSDPNVVSGPSDCNGVAVVSESYPMCFKIGTSWVHNTSTIIQNVSSVEECQSLCLESDQCIGFTWHRESHEPLSKFCELFPTIGEEITDKCPDCISGPKLCTCSDSVACSFDDQYLIDILTEIATEEYCQELCARNTKCSWYTWYSSEGWPFSQACALLSQCSDSKEILDGSVRSGLADCSIPVLPEQCKNYDVLNSPTRNYLVNETHFCNNTWCCDQAGYEYVRPEWRGDGWYRVTGEAGTKMIDTPVAGDHCGTGATGWLTGEHPSPCEGVVTRTVCFKHYGEDCQWQVDVNVLNCNNDYFVYYLVDTPICALGYCTE